MTDEAVIDRMANFKIALSPDFAGMAKEAALADLRDRIRLYERYYQTVREAEGAYIKMFDMRAKVHACNIYGRMAKSVLPYLLAMHSVQRPIFLLPLSDDDAALAAAGGGGGGGILGSILDAAGGGGGAMPSAGLDAWAKRFAQREEPVIARRAARRRRRRHGGRQGRRRLRPMVRAQLSLATASSPQRRRTGRIARDRGKQRRAERRAGRRAGGGGGAGGRGRRVGEQLPPALR